jgi:putative transposase
VKIRDGQIANRPIYVALAVTVDGERDILGLWSATAARSAKYWLHVLTKIKNRGIQDCCILVCDGLSGLADAVAQVWPATIVQTYVVHLLRNCFGMRAGRTGRGIARDLKPVYPAPVETARRRCR